MEMAELSGMALGHRRGNFFILRTALDDIIAPTRTLLPCHALPIPPPVTFVRIWMDFLGEFRDLENNRRSFFDYLKRIPYFFFRNEKERIESSLSQ